MSAGAAGVARAAERHTATLRMPEIVKRPGPGPVLLLAPHPDDEVLGAGGTLRKHVEADDRVTVLFITDGGRGLGRRCKDTAALREREARASCAMLGAASCEFLGAPDGGLEVSPALTALVREAIERCQPGTVYVPGYEERHRDHFMTAALLARVWKACGGDWTTCEYEVWTPLFPNCIVNVTDQMRRKRAALKCHASQLRRNNYLESMVGLARYRAALIPFPSVLFAEAFRCQSAKQHADSLERFLNTSRVLSSTGTGKD